MLSYFLEDEPGLAELLGTVSSDFIKIGLSAAVGMVAGMAFGSTMLLGSVAAAPLLIAVGFGVLTGIVLNETDRHTGATQALIQGYKKLEMDLANIRYKVNRNSTIWKRIRT